MWQQTVSHHFYLRPPSDLDPATVTEARNIEMVNSFDVVFGLAINICVLRVVKSAQTVLNYFNTHEPLFQLTTDPRP